MTVRFRLACLLLAGAQKLNPPKRDENGTRPVPIFVPPFDDDAAQKAAFGAALIHVTHIITGRWPTPEQLIAAQRLLEGEDQC